METDGRLVGVLSRAALIGALAQRGPAALASEVMHRDFQTADPAEMAEDVLLRLQSSKCPSMPVMQQGKVVGILTSENIGEFLMIHAALKGSKPEQAATA